MAKVSMTTTRIRTTFNLIPQTFALDDVRDGINVSWSDSRTPLAISRKNGVVVFSTLHDQIMHLHIFCVLYP